jgi:type IV pilus assembly protein PilQ
MRIKSLCILILVLIFNFTLYSKVIIDDVEYLKGEDFVQLHFKTDSIISIPDLFYPEKDNYKLIIMRINDVGLAFSKKNFRFESPVIKEINIMKNNEYVDVEIQLKEKVNYRVFTNTNGLYIEFPNVKKVKSEKKSNIESPIRKSKKPELLSYSPNRVNVIKDFKVSEKTGDKVKFEFFMSNNTNYNVIPIPEIPTRLAIDLKNIKSKRIKREINLLNVKRVRGAYNSPKVFRIVFDLLYLKDYRITCNNNVLEVEFSNKKLEEKTEIAKKVNPKEFKQDNSNLVLAQKREEVSEKELFKPSEGINIKDNKIALNLKAESIKNIDPTEKRDEFFTNEKSKITDENIGSGYVSNGNKDENNQIMYLKKTIEEGKKKYTGEAMNFTFKNADLNDVLKFIAKISGLNIVIDPGVTGRITCELIQVPWDQALELFLRINGLDMVLEGNILRIGRVDKLAQEARQRRTLKEAREMEGPVEVFTRTLSYAKVNTVKDILSKQLTQRGEILTDVRTNTLIISEVPDKIKLLDKLIDTLDAATLQVSIEARIIETNVNDAEALGIQWGYNFVADSSYGNQTSLKFPNSVSVIGNQISNQQNPGVVGPLGGYAINLPAQGRTSGTAFSFGNVANTFRLDVALSALQTKGKARIISAPKTTTQNNMEATIMQGRQIPVQTVQNNTVTVRYIPAALELKVTPQITAKGDVICKLDIQNNAADFANLVNGIPPIITQTTKNTVMVKDGGTIVIGGLYRVEESENTEGVPFLSKIPILGNLFKNSSKLRNKRELLIFVTPRIIK